ncbi:MAG: hypothetical protein IKU69_07245 [Roseburia sp.]|nr:hypothetical protein [Roseburia sp.]
MDKKITGIVGYLTWIGWLIAFLAGDREGAKFHLNQSLVLLIANLINSILSAIDVPFIPGILGLVLTVFWILGLVYAIKEEEKELPIVGAFKILN